jgi:hypothetical protein
MELPNEVTLEIIEERKKYLLEKSNKQNNKNNGYILREIKALDKVINLIKLIKNIFPDDLVNKIIEEKIIENDGVEKIDDNKGYKVLYSYEQNITESSKLDISFIEYEYNLKTYILIALKKYNLLKWVYQGKIKFTPSILEEILKKSYEIGIK